jgi:hypothetical protein
MLYLLFSNPTLIFYHHKFPFNSSASFSISIYFPHRDYRISRVSRCPDHGETFFMMAPQIQ